MQLAKRWLLLIQNFTQGRTDVEAGLKKMWADQKNWPAHLKKPYSDAVAAFVAAAGVTCDVSMKER